MLDVIRTFFEFLVVYAVFAAGLTGFFFGFGFLLRWIAERWGEWLAVTLLVATYLVFLAGVTTAAFLLT